MGSNYDEDAFGDLTLAAVPASHFAHVLSIADAVLEQRTTGVGGALAMITATGVGFEVPVTLVEEDEAGATAALPSTELSDPFSLRDGPAAEDQEAGADGEAGATREPMGQQSGKGSGETEVGRVTLASEQHWLLQDGYEWEDREEVFFPDEEDGSGNWHQLVVLIILCTSLYTFFLISYLAL